MKQKQKEMKWKKDKTKLLTKQSIFSKMNQIEHI